MDSTVWIAGMGFGTTLLAAWFGARWRKEADAEATLREARVRAYGECAVALWEYRRVTYNRVKARINGLPVKEREALRQETYRHSSAARSTIGQVAILAESIELAGRLDSVRDQITDLKAATDDDYLRARGDSVELAIEAALNEVRRELIGRRS